MGEKKIPTLKVDGTQLPIMLNMRGVRQFIVNWSDDTIRRRIEADDMPAHKDQDTGQWLFKTQEVLDWFKRRYGIAR